MLPHRTSANLRGYSYSCTDNATKFTDPPHQDHSLYPSILAQTLPFEKPVSPSASKTTSRRVHTAPSVPVPTSLPSKQAEKTGLRILHVHDLLNPTPGEDSGSESGSPLKRAADSSDTTQVLTVPLARVSHLQQRQERPSSQMQDCEGLIIPSLTPPHPIAQNVCPCTQSSAYDGVPHTESTVAIAEPLISQHQPFLNPLSSSCYTSTATPGTAGRYPMTPMDTGGNLLCVPIAKQLASEAADTKRKRNARAFHRFRQRRNEELETAKQISGLEQQIQELGKERDYYRSYLASPLGQALMAGYVPPYFPDAPMVKVECQPIRELEGYL